MLRKFRRFTRNMLRSMDMYSQTVNLNYNNKSNFSTVLGGFISIIAIGGMSAIAITYLVMMVGKTNVEFNKNEVFTNLAYDDTIHDLGETDFNVWIQLNNIDSSYTGQDFTRYITPLLLVYSKTDSNQGSSSTPFQYHGMRPCQQDDFPAGDNGDWDQGFPTYCTEKENLKLQGNRFNDDSKSFEVMIVSCWVFNSDCESQDDINNFVNQLIVTYGIIDGFFDYKDIDDPIGMNYDTSVQVVLSPYLTNTQRIFISNNEIELYDSIFGTSDSDKYHFYNIEQTLMSITNQASYGTYMSGLFELSKATNQYSRKVYNVFDFFSDLGGIFEAIQLMFSLIIGVFVAKIFYFSFVKNLNKTYKEKYHNTSVFDDYGKLEHTVTESTNHDNAQPDPVLDAKLHKVKNRIDEKNLQIENRDYLKKKLKKKAICSIFFPLGLDSLCANRLLKVTKNDKMMIKSEKNLIDQEMDLLDIMISIRKLKHELACLSILTVGNYKYSAVGEKSRENVYYCPEAFEISNEIESKQSNDIDANASPKIPTLASKDSSNERMKSNNASYKDDDIGLSKVPSLEFEMPNVAVSRQIFDQAKLTPRNLEESPQIPSQGYESMKSIGHSYKDV